MRKLDEFMRLLVGEFNNRQQFEEMQEKGNNEYPFCEHINTICNGTMKDLPIDYDGIFLVEESYYTLKDRKNASTHLFLFKEKENAIELTSYDLPSFIAKNFTYQDVIGLSYKEISESKKFTPALYQKEGDAWVGGSISMFTPVLKFTLQERFTSDYLEVSELMEVNGKRTMGYDEPILYKRTEDKSN